MATILIENWSLIFSQPHPYVPPEGCPARLLGNAHGHPKHHNGKYVETSRIVSTNGNRVKTRSGNTYVLGQIDPDYKAWLKKNHPHIDPDRPFPREE